MLYIKGFPATYPEDKIKEEFSAFGALESVDIRNRGDPEKIYAILTFEDAESAERAMEAKNGQVNETGSSWYLNKMMSKAERLHLLKKKHLELADRNLFVTNLPTSLSVDQLKKFFEHYGNIDSIKILTNTNIVVKDGKVEYEMMPKGVAFVSYNAADASQRALAQLNNVILQGNKIIVRRWKPNVPKDKKRKEGLSKYQQDAQ